MAIKQALAVKTMEAAAGGKVVSASMSEVTNGWVALVIKAADKKLVCVTQGECPLTAMWAVENSCEQDGLHVDIMSLNANNAAVIRRFVKWAAPSACGTKGTSIGFSDWLGAAGGCIAPLFAKKQVKPVLADLFYRCSPGQSCYSRIIMPLQYLLHFSTLQHWHRSWPVKCGIMPV